jgi:hypothetical protein
MRDVAEAGAHPKTENSYEVLILTPSPSIVATSIGSLLFDPLFLPGRRRFRFHLEYSRRVPLLS